MKAEEKHGEPQIIRDYKTMIYNLSHRTDLREEQKLEKLNTLAAKFSEGWPFKNNELLSNYNGGYGYRNELLRLTRTIHDRIHRQLLVKQGRDLGKMDNTELDSTLVHEGKRKTKPKKTVVVEKV
jgi:hypothetical protein